MVEEEEKEYEEFEKAYMHALNRYLNAFWFDEEEEREVLEVLRSKRLESKIGFKVKELEELIARYHGVKYAVATSSGTAALHLALAALGIGPGDEVVVPAISSLATANAVLYQNAVPVFADLNPRTLNMDPNSLAERITPRVKAVIVVHMYGCPADMKPIMEIAADHKLYVIEDCCLSMGAEYYGRKVGTIGDIGVFSFGSGKQLCTGQGGAAIAKDPEIGGRLKKLNHHYGVPRNGRFIGTADVLGFNYKMSEIVAALGVAQLRKLDKLNSKRIENAKYITEKLRSLDGKGIKLPYVPPGVKHVFNEYIIQVEEEKIGMSRDKFWQALIRKGIMADPLFDTPMYLEPLYRNKVGYGGTRCPFECPLYKAKGGHVEYRQGLCPVAEEVLKKVVAISPHPGLDREDLNNIVNTIRSLVEGKGKG